jgi:leucyl aminopeptidase
VALVFSVLASVEGADVLAFGVGTDLVPRGPGVTSEEVDAEFLRSTGFGGKLGETRWFVAGSRRLLAVGLGDLAGDPAGGAPAAGRGAPVQRVDRDDLRRAGAAAARAGAHVPRLVTTLHLAAPGVTGAVGAVVEGVVLAGYRYRADPEATSPVLAEVALVDADPLEVEAAEVRAAATLRTREWVNRPARQLRPRQFADEAAEAGRAAGLEVEVWDSERIEAEGLGCLAGVAAGSSEPPRLVRLTYHPAKARAHLALVGKGITFDSGGLSLKPAGSMETMKSDMGGAAAVLSTLLALPALRPDVWVDGWAAIAENMPSGDAIRPGDVLMAKNGMTVEVVNTDAEGRLVLADALLVAAEAQPDVIVDIATLTGGQRVALGGDVAGVLGTDDAVAAVIAAGQRAGEPLWRLPLWEGYRSKLDSDVADMRNVARDNGASTIIAALFLQRFVGNLPWAHLDIAAPSYVERADGWLSEGATGWGTRTLIELVTGWG